MKKLILLLTLSALIHVTTKAQNDVLADGVKNAAFPRKSNSQNYTATTIKLYTSNDSISIVKDYAFYMKKSKDQRKAGLIFLGSGLVLSGIGLLLTGNLDFNNDNIDYGFAVMGLGAISGIISIPLMITAHANRYKAKLMVGNQKTGFGVPANVSNDITGITLTLPIGK